MNQSKNIDDLINQLEGDLEPVKPMATPLHRAVMWFCAGLFSIIIIGAFVGFRMDLPEKMQNPIFIGELTFLFILCASAAYASAWLSLPDGAENKKLIYIPYAVVSVGAAALLFELFKHGFHVENFSFHHCVMDAMIMGAVPIVMMIWMMRQGAPTRPILAGFTNMIAAGAVGYLGLRLTCGSDDLSHVCAYHILPFVIVGLIVGLLARRLYRW